MHVYVYIYIYIMYIYIYMYMWYVPRAARLERDKRQSYNMLRNQYVTHKHY